MFCYGISMSSSGPQSFSLEALVTARDERLAHATRVFSVEPHVIGLFLGGSLGANSGDPYSDIDLRAVIESDHHADFVRRRLEIPSKWPGFVFNEWMPGAQHCVSHFEPFGKIDIFYLDEAQLPPRLGTVCLSVCFDPHGAIAELIDKSKNLAFEVAAEDVSQSIRKGLAALHEAIRRAKRGELVFAQTLLDELRHHMMKADDWLFERIPTTAVYAKFDERGSSSILDALRSSYCALNAGDILEAVSMLGTTYRQQVVSLHEQFKCSGR